MSVTYVIEKGYESNCVEVFNKKLENVINDIVVDHDLIIKEIKKEKEIYSEVEKDIRLNYLPLYIDCLTGVNPDLTIQLKKDNNGFLKIFQTASGGGEEREIKELIRKAICRLIILEMNKININVCYLVI